MKKLSILIVVSILSFIVSDSFAQRGMKWRGSGGWGMGSQYNRMYDPKTVWTIRGEEISVDMITPMKGMSQGVHLTLKTDKEIISANLGPGGISKTETLGLSQRIRLRSRAQELPIKENRLSSRQK